MASSIYCIVCFSHSLLLSSEFFVVALIHWTTLFIGRFISSDLDDLCPEEELFLILKKELGLPDQYHFTGKQKNEVYTLLNCQDQLKKKRQLPYKRLLHFLSKTFVDAFLSIANRFDFVFSLSRTLPISKERSIEKKEVEEKPLTPPRKLAYVS